ncbi:hypothetical protein GY45DRAFT_1334742 [Cubamyces sp. BRFM 1775]|nr:hypothetical protein GY45DRAFT_1334742 [Cubamyces sp. BRFM 1775]
MGLLSSSASGPQKVSQARTRQGKDDALTYDGTHARLGRPPFLRECVSVITAIGEARVGEGTRPMRARKAATVFYQSTASRGRSLKGATAKHLVRATRRENCERDISTHARDAKEAQEATAGGAAMQTARTRKCFVGAPTDFITLHSARDGGVRRMNLDQQSRNPVCDAPAQRCWLSIRIDVDVDVTAQRAAASWQQPRGALVGVMPMV